MNTPLNNSGNQLMFRTSMACCLFVISAGIVIGADSDADTNSTAPSAEVRKQLNWEEWRRLPVLHEGRIKPLDTFSEEIVTLVTARSKWTDTETEPHTKYRAPELLFAWITDPETWLDKPVIRCEYRPLRELLNTDTIDILTEGTYVSLRDVLDWEQSLKTGKEVYWSTDLAERLDAIDKAARQNKDPDTVGETADDRALNSKVAEFFRHMQAFIGVRDARNIFIVPGIDPRILTKQTNPDDKIRTWVSLGALLRLNQWSTEADITVTALMADDPKQLLGALLTRRMYKPEHIPQLAQAQKVKSQLQVDMSAIKPALDATREAYDKADAQAFGDGMKTFSRKIRRLASSLEDARLKMTPPETNSIDFGQVNDRIWALYEPLELNEHQMAFSSYPELGSTDMELTYNRYKPFQFAWIFFLLASAVVMTGSTKKAHPSIFMIGLLATAGAIAFSTWGFAMRSIIAERPPVTNMYETVIWVSYVVSVLGLWFCILPWVWPGVAWSWRLTGLPVRFQRSEGGAVSGVELDSLQPDDSDKFLAQVHLPIQCLASVLRLAGFVGMMAFLSRFDASSPKVSSFQITTLVPPIFGETVSYGSLGTWCVGISTVLLSAWYLPRAALALAGSVLTIIPEAKRNSRKYWEQTFARRYFLMGAVPVAFFGMMLAHFVGMSNPEILNPRIGSIAAVLRNNYWLTIHVLTIVSSYGAGALTWGLGNMAMLYYLFGKYRSDEPKNGSVLADGNDAGEQDKKSAAGPIFDLDAAYGRSEDSITGRLKKAGKALKPAMIGKTLKAGVQDFGSGDAHLESTRVRPPSEVSTLAGYGYKSMQVAVLLLAAGTILGGLWADVSWGRFWDWDPKEVWALISLLVYLAVLHGRFAGWVGTFGTNVACVGAFAVIMMSWYGVNFVLPQIHGWWNGTGEATEVGLHSYATGAGGWEYVAGAVVLNFALVLLAWGRYAVETTDLLNRKSTSAGEQTSS